MPEFSNVTMIGTGAIGGYYGARLARAGVDTRFLARSDMAPLRQHGFRVRTPQEEFSVNPVKVFDRAAAIGPSDLVIVGIKATGNDSLLKLLPPLLHERSVLLTLENGLGSDEFLARHFGSGRVIGGLCFIAVNRVAPGDICCLHPGTLSLGEFGRPVSPRLRELATMFNQAGVKTDVGNDLSALRWKKLVWNIPFNGLSIAAGGVTTDRILGELRLEPEVRTLMTEVILAAGKLGHRIPLSFIDHQVSITRPMGPYKPSSLVDYLAGREVEVEAIWGEPLRRAQAVGAEVPRLQALYSKLKELTSGR